MAMTDGIDAIMDGTTPAEQKHLGKVIKEVGRKLKGRQDEVDRTANKKK